MILLWDSHENFVVENVNHMYRSEEFCDCRLIGAGGFSLYCHQLVLSCSPVLKLILENCHGFEPVITLSEVSPSDLAALVDFLYRGEVCFAEETLPGFLDLCKMLEVPGFQLPVEDNGVLISSPGNEFLCVEPDDDNVLMTDDWIVSIEDDSSVFHGNDQVFTEDNVQINEVEDSTLDEAKVKKKKRLETVNITRKYSNKIVTKSQAKHELNLNDIRDLGANHSKRYQCKKCGNKYSHKRTITHHLYWICGQPPTHACEFCNYRGKRRFQLKSHLLRFHQISTSVKKDIKSERVT